MSSEEKNRLAAENFIKRAKELYGDRYDYSEAVYVNAKTKIKITDNETKEVFYVLPNNHLRRSSYRTNRIRTTERFVKRAREVYRDRYDYSKTVFKQIKIKVEIICRKHGSFFQAPENHLNKGGCPKCAGRGLSQEERIELFQKAHGDKYDYSLVNYVSPHDKIKIICKKCGKIFEQTPNAHLSHLQGYPKCAMENKKSKGCVLIEEYLQKNNISFLTEYRIKEINKMSYDYFIKDYNLLIEYDGSQRYYKKIQNDRY